MKKNKKTLVVGFTLFAAAILCNLNWAVNDYGVKEISLNPRILAQTGTEGTEDGTGTGTGTDTETGTGTGTGTGEDSKKGFKLDQADCVYSLTGKVGATVKLGWLSTTFDAHGKAEFRFTNAQTLCKFDGDNVSCNQMTCGEFFISLGTASIQ